MPHRGSGATRTRWGFFFSGGMKYQCVACILESKKVHPKNPPAHTCAKAKKGYREPEVITDCDNRKLYKIIVYDELAFNDTSTLFRLEHQFLNGYSVKRFSELWIPSKHHTKGKLSSGENCVWVDEKFYQKLVFL